MKYETLEEKHQASLASYERSKANKLARLALERTKQPTVSEWFKQTPIGEKLYRRRMVEAEDAYFTEQRFLEKLPHKLIIEGTDAK